MGNGIRGTAHLQSISGARGEYLWYVYTLITREPLPEDDTDVLVYPVVEPKPKVQAWCCHVCGHPLPDHETWCQEDNQERTVGAPV